MPDDLTPVLSAEPDVDDLDIRVMTEFRLVDDADDEISWVVRCDLAVSWGDGSECSHRPTVWVEVAVYVFVPEATAVEPPFYDWVIWPADTREDSISILMRAVSAVAGDEPVATRVTTEALHRLEEETALLVDAARADWDGYQWVRVDE